MTASERIEHPGLCIRENVTASCLLCNYAEQIAMLQEALEALLRHDFAEKCQECGIGKSKAWAKARAAVAEKGNPE